MRNLVIEKLKEILKDYDFDLELEFFRGGMVIKNPEFFDTLQDEELLEIYEELIWFNG